MRGYIVEGIMDRHLTTDLDSFTRLGIEQLSRFPSVATRAAVVTEAAPMRIQEMLTHVVL